MLPAVSSSGGGLDGEDASAAEGGEGMVSPVLSSPGENSGEEVEGEIAINSIIVLAYMCW